jgi:hypothetical protein
VGLADAGRTGLFALATEAADARVLERVGDGAALGLSAETARGPAGTVAVADGEGGADVVGGPAGDPEGSVTAVSWIGASSGACRSLTPPARAAVAVPALTPRAAATDTAIHVRFGFMLPPRSGCGGIRIDEDDDAGAT